LPDVDGSDPNGVGGAAASEPGFGMDGGYSPVHADTQPASQAENGAFHDYCRHDLDATLGWLVRMPPAEHEKRLTCFRRGYGLIFETARDPRVHPKIREAFSKVWKRWRRRSPALYPEELRDQIFAEAEIERDVWTVGWGRVANLPLFQPPMLAEADAMLEKYRGRDEFVAWLMSHPLLLAEVIPHLQDSDVPRDLVLFVYEFVLVALREPDKLTAFQLEYRGVFKRLEKPLVREAQTHVDALNASKTAITKEEPAVGEPARPIASEIAPPAASSLPPDDEEQPWANGTPAVEENPPRRSIDTAFENANFGWPVFPCDPKTKKPLTPREKDPKTGKPINGTGWRMQATTDFGVIRYRWGEDPNAMVGIPTGEVIGAFVLEIDVADKDGNVYTTVTAQTAAIEAELGVKLPDTMRVRTPRGGEHWYYKSDYGFPRNSASIKRGRKQLRGVDVRGDGGYIIAAGSIRDDGKSYEWASDHRYIAMAPIELVDFVCGRGRWAPEQVPPAESVTTAVAGERIEKPTAATPSSTRKAVQEVCQRWAAAALDSNAAELASAKPGRRNTLTNILAYRMGRMIAAGWIAERLVTNALFAACKANGLVQDDGADQVRATTASGLAAGKRKPLRELPDRPRKLWQPIDGDDDNWFLRGLRSEIRALYRMRFPGNPAAADEADRRLWEIGKVTFDPWKIGQELRLTFGEYQRLARENHGRKRVRLPAKMLPADVSPDVIDAFRKDRKRTQNLICQTKKRAKKRAEQSAINDLDDKESAIHAYLQNHPGPQSVDDIYEGVRRSRAFKMKPGSIRNAIRRLIDPPSEKLRNRSRLAPLITLTKSTAKNGGLKILVELRKNEAS
jgi:hypothetical protein